MISKGRSEGLGVGDEAPGGQGQKRREAHQGHPGPSGRGFKHDMQPKARIASTAGVQASELAARLPNPTPRLACSAEGTLKPTCGYCIRRSVLSEVWRRFVRRERAGLLL